jgi:putative DNA primase/helicase
MVGSKMPAPTLSRCIFVKLYRRKKDETVEKFKHEDDSDLADLRRRLCRWAADTKDLLRNNEPPMPDELMNRRADNWSLQFAIADLAGEDWGDRARAAAVKIEAGFDKANASARALASCKVVLGGSTDDEISTTDLIKGMCAEEDSEWNEWSGGNPITPKQLSNLLKPYSIGPEQVRPGGGRQVRGYKRSRFLEMWERYL